MKEYYEQKSLELKDLKVKYKKEVQRKISNILRMAAPEGALTLQGGLVL